MYSSFIDEDFLLATGPAKELYHGYAAQLPIVDYHCHLPPAEVAEDRQFETLTQLWLGGDHYKWRAMRTNGVDERLCSGSASDWEKFAAWAETVPHTLRNPLYHWTHLELKNPFGIDALLGPSNAKEIYEQCNQMLAKPELSARGLLRHFKVLVVCTTDDPVDSLESHRKYRRVTDLAAPKMLPTWRPDRALDVHRPELFTAWLSKLEERTDFEVSSFEDFMLAIERRHSFFHESGCRLSDHGLEVMHAATYDVADIKLAFEQVRRGRALSEMQVEQLRSAMLYEFAKLDESRGWVQQFHLGAMRNNNTRLLKQLGPDTGFDSIGDFPQAQSLARFLDRLDAGSRLAKTIVYNLNPRDNELMATMIGNFQDGSVAGKLQYGAAWWFLDQLDGMTRQLDALSNMGLLSRFVGMLTDSRSFLSYSRHEYFRRLLCNILGDEIERGLIPRDFGLVGDLVRAVCFENARDFFGFELPDPTPEK